MMIFKSLWENKISRVGIIIMSFFIIIAIFGPIIFEPPKSNYFNRLQPPSFKHWLGTDYAGKDTLIQLILGARGVLLVAVYTAIFAIIFACVIGIIAGLAGGFIDTALMLITNIIITIPSFPVMMILSMTININNAISFGLVLSLWSWAEVAKSIRVQVLSLKQKEFIEANKFMCINKNYIVVHDILPNLISYISVNFIVIMKNAMLSSVGLMYLGLVPFDGNHWGMMIYIAISQTGALLGGGSIIYFLAPVTSMILFQLGAYLIAIGIEEGTLRS